MKERLIELIKASSKKASEYIENSHNTPSADKIYNIRADYLLANDVIVPPCRVGDYVEWDTGLELRLCRVNGFIYHTNDEIYPLRYELDDCQPIVTHNAIKRIIPKEEAERALNKTNGAVSLIDGHIDEA